MPSGDPSTIMATLDDPHAVFAACRAALKAGRPEAATLLQQLLERFPAYGVGWEMLGHDLRALNKPEAALVCFRRAAITAPSARLALACGRTLRQLGRNREARAAFAEACRRDPSSAVAHFLAGVAAQDDRDPAAAAAAYRQALDRDPALAEAAVNLGTVLQATGDLAGARQAYGRAMRQRPDAFGRVAQALTGARRGELWLDLEGWRRDLAG